MRWAEAAALFVESGKLIIELCRQAIKYDGKACSTILIEIADTEQEAYEMLTQ